MKWYVYKDDGTNYTMILDHNTTAGVAYNSTGSNSEMKEVKETLEKDTNNWKKTARLITANEVASITGHPTFDASKTEQDWFYLDSNNQTQKANATNKSQYAWLYDYTIECTDYGCNTADASTWGYWTSTANKSNSTSAWRVHWLGSLNCNGVVSDTGHGARPVITIPKSIIS